MGILGGSRIDSLTVFLAVTLVLYTLLVTGVTATFTGSTWNNPYSGVNLVLDFTEDYAYNDVQNISRPAIPFIPSSATFDDLNPTRELDWYSTLTNNTFFNVYSHYYDWWNDWLAFGLKPENYKESEILDNYDSELNSSKKIFSQGGKYETAVFFCPLFYYNETDYEVTYIYSTLQESFYNDEITVVMATNATYTNYGIGDAFGVLTGFSGFDNYGIPAEIKAIIATVFWVLVVLTIVKLVVG